MSRARGIRLLPGRGVSYALALVVLGLVWHVASLALGPYLLPAPISVLALLARQACSAVFWQHVGSSAFRVLAGLALGWFAGFPLGLVLGHARRLDRLVSPLVFLTYPLPKIVLLPVFLTLLGLGDAPRILLIALTAGYQIVVVTRAAGAGLDRRYRDSFRSLGGSPAQLVRHVLVPAALPDALTALKVASGTAVAVLFMAESFATRSGLGFLIMDAWGRGDQEEMFVGIVSMSIMGVLLYEGCGLLERLLCRWKKLATV